MTQQTIEDLPASEAAVSAAPAKKASGLRKLTVIFTLVAVGAGAGLAVFFGMASSASAATPQQPKPAATYEQQRAQNLYLVRH